MYHRGTTRMPESRFIPLALQDTLPPRIRLKCSRPEALWRSRRASRAPLVIIALRVQSLLLCAEWGLTLPQTPRHVRLAQQDTTADRRRP